MSLETKNVCDCNSLVYFLFLGPYPGTIFFFFIKITLHKHNTTAIGEITKNEPILTYFFDSIKNTYLFHNKGPFQILGAGPEISCGAMGAAPRYSSRKCKFQVGSSMTVK